MKKNPNTRGPSLGLMSTLVSLMCLALAGTGLAQGTMNLTNETALSWTTTGGIGGAVYEIQNTGVNPLKIWRVGFRPNAGGTHLMDVYYRVGGCFPTYPPSSSTVQNSGWVHSGSATVTFPTNTVTQIPVDMNVSLPVNGVLGILVNSTTATPQYVSSSSSPNFSNSELTIRSQGGKTSTTVAAPGTPPGTPFSSGNFPRVMPTTIWYDYDQFPGTHMSVESVQAGGTGGLSVGNNTVQAGIKNMGTTALDNTPIHAEYSTDGGTTWSATQTFSFPSFPVLSNQTITFTAPWNVSGYGVRELRVRLVGSTPVGQGTALKSRTYTPDLDVSFLAVSPAPALNTPLTVALTIANNGDYNHNGAPLQLRYTRDNVNYVTDSFVPTTLGPAGTQIFSFAAPLTIAVPGTYNLTGSIGTAITGDPDPVDEFTIQLSNVGVSVATYAPTAGVTATTLSPPIYRSSSTTTPGYRNVYQMIYLGSDITGGLSAGAVITNLAFNKTNDHQSAPGEKHRLRVWLQNTTDTAITASVAYDTVAVGSTLVYDNGEFVLPEATGWLDFGPFNRGAPFIYAGNNLKMTIEFDALVNDGLPVTVPGPSASTGLAWQYENITGGSGLGSQFTTMPAPTTSVGLNGLNSATRRPHCRFFYNPAGVTDLDITGVTFGTTTPQKEPSTGSNTVNVEVTSFGSGGYTGSYSLQVSTDGGSTWGTAQSVTASGLTTPGSTQTVVMTAPFVISTFGPQSLRVRFAPQVTGDPDQVDIFVGTYDVDVDIEQVTYGGSIVNIGNMVSVHAVVRNAGNFNLTTQSIGLRYAIDNGTTVGPWVNQVFPLTGLAGHDDTMVCEFTPAVLFPAAGAYTVVVEVLTGLTGDPDATDSNSVTLPEVGNPVVNVGQAQFPGASPVSNAIPFGSYTNASFMTWWHPEQLGYKSGDITEFGFQFATPATETITNVKITLGETTTIGFANTTDYLGYFNVGTPTVVYDAPLTLAVANADDYFRVVLSTPVNYSGKNKLLVYIELTGNPSGGPNLRNYSGGSLNAPRFYSTSSTGPTGSSQSLNYGAGASFYFVTPSNPGIAVTRDSNPLPNNGSDDYGITVDAGVQATRTYTITNRGATQNLNISGIAITNHLNCTAALSGTAPTTVNSGNGTATFSVNVTPGPGAYGFRITIFNNASNLSDQNYVIDVTGTGFVNAAPTIGAPVAGGDKTMLISEVSSDVSSHPSTGSEYIELTNVSASPVDMSGWHIFVYEQTSTTPYSGYPKTLPTTAGVVPGGGTFCMVDSGTPINQGLSLGSNILWNSGSGGGVVIVDPQNNIRDCYFWGGINPALVSVPVPGGPTLSIGSEWNGPAASYTVVFQSTQSRSGVLDSDDASDWTQAPTGTMGFPNPGLTTPFGGGNLQISGTDPSYTVETVVGSSLVLAVIADDVDTHQNITMTIAVATGGSLTPTAAGFTNTFPVTVGPGAPALAGVFQGTAMAAGTVNFTVTVTDNGSPVGQDTVDIQYRIGARTEISAMSADSTFVRVNGTKDFYRGQQAMPINLTYVNDNNFAVQLTDLDFLVLDAVTETPLSGFTFTLQNAPVTVPANSTAGVPVVVHMDIGANAGGTNGMSCILKFDSGDAVDPANPSGNPVVVAVAAAAAEDEFDLYDGPAPTPMQISTTSLATAVETAPYLQNLSVSGGSGTFTWSVAASSAHQLPAGLSLDPNGSQFLQAKIFGSAASGTSGQSPYSITLAVDDGSYVDTATFSLAVIQYTPLSFTPNTLANGMEYEPYAMTTPFTASGGTLVYTFSVDAGGTDQLPAGLTLDPQSGVISGTPADATQRSYSITFIVSDGQSQASQTLALVIDPHALEWRGTTLPAGEETVAYAEMLDAIGGTGPRIYAIDSGNLPAGLTLNPGTGEISGVPAVASAGTYNLVFKVTDSLNVSVTQAITIGIAVPPPLTVSTEELAYGEIGVAYSMQVDATGGSRSYTFTLSTGSQLPASLTMDPSGLITGTPAFGDSGSHVLDIEVDDGFGTDTRSFALHILQPDAPDVVVSEVDTGTGYIELAHTGAFPINLSGWSIVVWADGNTPLALPFDSLPGATLALPGDVVTFTIGGTAGGTYPAFSTGGSWSATATSDLAVLLRNASGAAIGFVRIGSLSTAALVDGNNDPLELPAALDSAPAVSSGSANYSLGATGYTGSAAGTPGAYNAGLPAKPLALIKADLREAIEGEAYSDFAAAIGGTPPYSYSITAPTATWLSINAATGALSGTVPAASAGQVTVDVTVADSTTASVSSTVTLDILAATTAPSVTYAVGTGQGQSFEGTVISMPVTMAKSTGAPDVNGFSFVLELATATAAELDVLDVRSGAATIAAGRTVRARDIGNNRVWVTSLGATGSSAIAAGEIAVVTFIVPTDDTVMAPTGTYPVTIHDVHVDNDGTQVRAEGTNGQLVLENYKPQDVNRDDSIDVVDVQMTVNIILQLFTPTYTGQGDANEDTSVDVVDVQTIVNCILSSGC